MASPLKSSFLTCVVFFYFHRYILGPPIRFAYSFDSGFRLLSHVRIDCNNFPNALALFYNITSLPDLRLSENSEPCYHIASIVYL